MKPGLRTLLALCVVPLGVPACTPTPPAQPRLVRSMLEERQGKVVIQQWDVSCGAAALASLLTYDMDVPMTERQVAAGMLRYTSVERVQQQLGFSLLDLKRYSESLGFTADGFGNMTLRDLTESAPAIVPVVLRGFNHFVIFRGIQGDRVLLADPAWGNRTMQVPYFMEVWGSRVAFTVNQTTQTASVHHLRAQSSDFWASSRVYEQPAKAQVVAQLMDKQPDASQMVASAASPDPLTTTAAGPATPFSANAAAASREQAALSKIEAAPPAPNAAVKSRDVRTAQPRDASPVKPVSTSTSYRKPADSDDHASRVEPRPIPEGHASSGATAGTVGQTNESDARRAFVAAIMKRAATLAPSDIGSARALYTRAGQAGSGQAAEAAGRTYDPNILRSAGLGYIHADPVVAKYWYRIAIALGNETAKPLLDALDRPQGT
jgi:predicted double-glycine peptidase